VKRLLLPFLILGLPGLLGGCSHPESDCALVGECGIELPAVLPPACEPGSTEPCYDGPASTEGVGLCRGGTRRCLDDGSAFGACEGATLPTEETCDTPDDDDCDGSSNEEGDGCVCTPNASVACFDGLETQLGVGECLAGTTTCNALGTAVGETCEGQVLPADEVCLDGDDRDEDCDGLACGALAWAKLGNGPTDDTTYGVAFGPDGSIVATGFFNLSMGWGANPTNTQGLGSQLFVSKLDPSGAELWTVVSNDVFQSFDLMTGYDVAVDGAGRVAVVGSFAGTGADVLGATLANGGGEDAFALLLDASGAVEWLVGFGDDKDQRGLRVAFDPSGDVVVAGEFAGTMMGLTAAVNPDVFVAKLSGQQGDTLWSRRFGAAMADELLAALDVAADGSIALGGGYTTGFSIGSTALTAHGSFDAFVTKLDGDGNPLWALGFGDANISLVTGVAFDGSGDLTVTGAFQGSLGLPGFVATSQGKEDLFVARLAGATGGTLTARVFGDAESQFPFAISADVSGHVALTGRFGGTLITGFGAPLVAIGSFDAFLLTLESDLTTRYAVAFGGGTSELGYDVRFSPNGDAIALGGTTSDELTTRSGTLPGHGGYDAFIAKVIP
jgi:hypothetical protein